METMVIPNIENVYRRERARDELPQSGSGRTIMTAEPKFVPEEAVEVTMENGAAFSVRLSAGWNAVPLPEMVGRDFQENHLQNVNKCNKIEGEAD